MSEDPKYQPKQVVWAKVGDHPWWPGKVQSLFTQIMTYREQDDRNVYKVNFFGDSTYCYLHEENIVSFPQRQLPTPDSQNWDSKLKKPIQLAIAVLNKAKLAPPKQSKYKQPSADLTEAQPYFFEETKIQSKESIQVPQKTPSYEQQCPIQNQECLEELIGTCVTPENVVGILEGSISRKLSNFKGYNQRKRAFDYKSQLEHQLLRKYNILNLDQSNQKKPQMVRLVQAHLHRRIKKRNTPSLKTLCISKLYKMLKGKSMERTKAQEMSVDMMSRVQQMSTGDSDKFKKLYMMLLKWVANTEGYHIVSYDSIFFSQLANSKREEQDNSKLTQISVGE